MVLHRQRKYIQISGSLRENSNFKLAFEHGRDFLETLYWIFLNLTIEPTQGLSGLERAADIFQTYSELV